MTNDSIPEPSIDPYDAPNVDLESVPSSRLGRDFWMPILFSMVISFTAIATLFLPGMPSAFLPWAFLFGFFGSLTTAMAIARGVVWQSRLPFLEKSHQETNGFALFLKSMVLGFCATLISVLCCEVICVPMGFVLIDIKPISGGMNGTSTLILLSIICTCLGLFVGTLFVRWTVPKVPNE